jgi:hypothetical protein
MSRPFNEDCQVSKENAGAFAGVIVSVPRTRRLCRTKMEGLMTFVTETQIEGTQGTRLVAMAGSSPDRTGSSTVNAADCLKFIQNHATTLNVANTTLLSAAVIYIRDPQWAELPKTKRQITAALASAFKETAGRRSKRYEFTNLAWQIAQNPEAKTLAAEAVRAGSTVSAIQHLADNFQKLATSVAELARHFGTTRSSGRREHVRRASFPDWLRKAVERARRDGAGIEVVECMNALLSHASAAELLRVIKRLLPQIGDDGLRELGEIIARTLVHRESRDRRSSQRNIEITQMHASSQ